MDDPKPLNPQVLAITRHESPGTRPPAHPGYVEIPYDSEGDLSSSSIRDYLHTIFRRRWLILAAGAGGLLLGLSIMVSQPLKYAATTSVEVQGFNESFMKMNEVDPQASAGIYAANSYNILTQVRILNSDTVRRRVLEKLERESIPSLPPPGTGLAAVWNRLRSTLGLNPTEPTKALREALQSASGSAAAKAVQETRVIEIRCESPHPEVAAEFLNTLVNEFVDQSLESRAKASQRTSQWLANQLEEQKAKLEQAEAKLREFVAGSGVMGLTQEEHKSTLAESKVQQLQQELAALQADRVARQSRFEMASSRGVEALPELLQGSSLPAQQSTLADLRRQRAELLATLTPAHYKVKKIQAQINEVESAIQKERGQILQRVRNEYESALQREKLLTGAYTGQAGAVLSQADKGMQYSMLRREVDSNRSLYNAMVQQVNQAGIAAAVPTNNIRVIDLAIPAFAPSYRSIYIAGGLGWTTGLLFGCVLAIVLQQLDRRLRAPNQLGSVLNLPELGVIPSELAAKKGSPMRLRIGRHGVRLARGAVAPDGNGHHQLWDGQPYRIELITHQQKPSPVAESFRATLTSILFSIEGQQHCVWGVTSPNPKEGKSTVVSNLAIALAELRRRVLLIDADLRKPRLHDVFSITNTWGLTDILQESTPIDQYPLDSLARPTEIPNLFLLPSGPAVPVINSLLYSERVKILIARLRGEFDTVLIDTPPMMVLPDARILGQLTDAVILVLRSGVTSLDDARVAGRRLIEDGTKILGTVLNDWKPPSMSGHYYNYYSSYHSSHDSR